MSDLITDSLKILGIFFVALFFVMTEDLSAHARELHVFMLHSYHQEYSWTKMEHEGFVSALSQKYTETDITFETEYLNAKRVQLSESYEVFFSSYLSRKYSNYKPDIVVLTDDDALKFYSAKGASLFPGVPVIFCGVNNLSAGNSLDPAVYTGVYEVKDVAQNIKLAANLFPESLKIYVVGDNSATDLAIRRDITKLINTNQSGATVEFLADSSIDSLIKKLGSIQEGTLLLTTIGGFRDARNQNLPLKKVIKLIRESGNFIIISMEDAYMLDGVLGGYVTNGRLQGATAAEIAFRVLAAGESPSSLRPMPVKNVPTFDHSQLSLLEIKVSELPEGSVVLNTPRSLYKEFQAIIWTTLAIIFSLVALLVLLSLSNLRRKKAESALAESERFLTSVIENIPDMIFVKRSDDLTFVRINRAGEDIFGASRDTILGKNDYDFFPADDADFFTRKDREVLLRKTLLEIPEEPIGTKSGTRYLHTKKIPLMNQEGNPVYLLGISRDITEEKKQKEKRIELEERLFQAEKMESIGTLAGGIAHDFNNILSSVIGYTELARIEAENPEKVRMFLDGSMKGSARAKELIRQILTFSRKNDQQKIPLELTMVTRDALKMVRSTLPSTISIEESLDSNATILADSTQIHQIILNLCTNAYHAMLESGGTIAVSLKEVQLEKVDDVYSLKIQAGKYTRLEVSDSGSGMDAETQQRMFDPYYTTKGSEAGTGLGLAVVHGIVKSHNGYIHVYSEKGVGTTIHVYFPIVENQNTPQAIAIDQKQPNGGDEHILLVDDEPDLIRITEDILMRFGYQVTSFTDGLQALEEVRQWPEKFDMLLTDMTMPLIIGTDLAQEVWELVPHLPVILCTGHSEIVNREKALAMGIREYCEKPVSVDNLLWSVRNVLDAKSV